MDPEFVNYLQSVTEELKMQAVLSQFLNQTKFTMEYCNDIAKIAKERNKYGYANYQTSRSTQQYVFGEYRTS